MFSSGPPPGACAGQLDVGGPAALAWTAPPPPGRRRPRASTSFCGVSRTAEHEVVKMQKAVGFDKEKCSCNICLTLVCSFISAKWSINQSGMVFRFLRGSVINLVPVLMKNGGGRPRDSENVYITRKVIMACNSATHLPTCRRGPGGQARTPQPRGGGRSVSRCCAHHGPILLWDLSHQHHFCRSQKPRSQGPRRRCLPWTWALRKRGEAPVKQGRKGGRWKGRI